MIRAIIEHASRGCLPMAVSADSMTASAPSNTAAATSLASARVGRVDSTIDCSISVATITGVCCSRQLPMISLCTTGTCSGDSSTPRSPRATITRVGGRDHLPQILDRLGRLDLRDDRRRAARLPARVSQRDGCRRRACTNESAT